MFALFGKAPRDFVTFEYVMLRGVNDSVAQAKELVKLVRDVPCKFNLIPFNPFPESGLKVSSRDQSACVWRKSLLEAASSPPFAKRAVTILTRRAGNWPGQVLDRTRRNERAAEQN